MYLHLTGSPKAPLITLAFICIMLRGTASAQIDIEVPESPPKAEHLAPTPQPSATPNPTATPALTSAPLPVTPSPAPAATVMPTPSATPVLGSKSKTANGNSKFNLDLKAMCERHFPGAIQAEVRAACSAAGSDFEHLGRALVETRCRLHYGEEPRLVMSCLIGASIASDLVSGHQEFKRKLQLCAETYPVLNEIDAFLQESCLTGVYIPEWMESDRNPDRAALCAQITPERSFIGPCAVGLSLIQDDITTVPPTKLSTSCAQYFDSTRFHKGYRACVNARSLAPQMNAKVGEVIKSCSSISSEAGNETERAACFVGLNLYKHLIKKEDISARFQKCGSNKVTYQDRDFLACLTAGSLLDFTDKPGAESGCREIFKEAKSHGRADCASSLSLF